MTDITISKNQEFYRDVYTVSFDGDSILSESKVRAWGVGDSAKEAYKAAWSDYRRQRREEMEKMIYGVVRIPGGR